MSSSIWSHAYNWAHSKLRKKLYLWAFFTLAGFIVVADIFILRKWQPPRSHLDDYQPLTTGRTDHDALPIRHGQNTSSLESASRDERAVVSTLFSESYTDAVLTLGHSLQTSGISARMILLYFPDRLSSRTICTLESIGWELHPTDRIPPPDGGRNVFYRFVDNYSKLHIWALDKIGIKWVVYLDADMLVLRNFDELWSLPFAFAAVPDVYGNRKGFALSFNAGMMYLRTSSAVFSDLLSKIDSYAYVHVEAEQGLLNMYFAPRVVLLPYIYNANLMLKQRSTALWGAMEKDTRAIHYTVLKPFIEQERQRARNGIWEPEMKLWDSAWRNVSASISHMC